MGAFEDFLKAQASGQPGYGVSAAPQAASGPMAYIGGSPGLVPEVDTSRDALTGRTTGVQSSPYKTVDEATLMWYSWDEKDREELAQSLYDNKLIKDKNDFDSAFKWWSQAVKESANFHAVGKDVTPQAWLDQQGAYAKAAQGDPLTRQQIQRNTSVMDDGTAEQIVKAMYQKLVGRDPSDRELAVDVGRIVSASEAAQAVTSSTTTTNEDGSLTSSSSVYRPGFTEADAQNMILDKLDRDPEAGTYQAVSTYANALYSLIGSL